MKRRLTLCIALLAAAVVLLWHVDPRQWPMPLCAFHRITGLHCPGCGATRATHELLHGRLGSALQCNALWVLSLPLVVYFCISEAVRLGRGRALPGDLLRRPWFLGAVIATAVVFGVLRNIPVEPLVWLVPPG